MGFIESGAGIHFTKTKMSIVVSMFSFVLVLCKPSILTPLFIVIAMFISLFIEQYFVENMIKRGNFIQLICNLQKEQSSFCKSELMMKAQYELQHEIIRDHVWYLIPWFLAAVAARIAYDSMPMWVYRCVPPDTIQMVKHELSSKGEIVLLALAIQSVGTVGTYHAIITGEVAYLIAGMCGMAGIFRYYESTIIGLINETHAMKPVLKRRSLQQTLHYVAIVHDCDMPIIEALYNSESLNPLLQLRQPKK